jgi:hypothetical protein
LASSTLDPRSHGLSADIAHLFYFVGAACEHEGVREDESEDMRAVSTEVAAARREAAMASARLAEISMKYADVRTASDREDAAVGRPGRAKPGEFVADELSLMLREQPYAVRCLIARSRRLSAAMPTVWQAYRDGDLDHEQVRVIDRVARRVCEPLTLDAIDEQSVQAAQSRCPKQLGAWLLRLVVRLELEAFQRRHRRALAERRVTVIQGVDGMGYVTGEVSAADAAAIDGMLAAAARSLSANDPRSDQQRRSDLFADLLLGRLRFAETDEQETVENGFRAEINRADQPPQWLEVEDIDPDTGELLGTHLQPLEADGEPVGEPIDPATELAGRLAPAVIKSPRQLRIGVIVPLSSLLGLSDAPGELADRSGLIPGQVLREAIVDALDGQSRDDLVFTRLLTDDGGRLMDTTELGRYASARLAQAIRVRAATCRFPSCNVPADRCDLDHHQPWPNGRTSAQNLDPLCRRHHRGKTFAWLASVRDDDTVDWTMPDAHRYHCVDEPLPTGVAA